MVVSKMDMENVHGSEDTWFKLIKAKYMVKGNFFCQLLEAHLKFGKGCTKLNTCSNGGAVNKIMNGKGTLFWTDTWFRDVPLKLKDPKFFDICRDKNVRVVDYCEDGEWDTDPMWDLMVANFQVWDDFVIEFNVQILTHGRDEVIWVLDKSRTFTTQSLYRFYD
jgi:hypothetical protein